MTHDDGVQEKRCTRRELLGKAALAATGVLGAALPSCYFDLEYSPYMTNVDHKNLITANLARLKGIESDRPSGGAFRIGLMSDTHHFFSETKEVVRIFNARNDLDFVIVIGDTTDMGLLREFNWSYDVIRKLNCPFIMVVGNHDCLDHGIEIFTKMYGPLNYVFSFLGTDFICFNNNNWESGDPDYGWLERAAASSAAERRILLSHIDNSNGAFHRFGQSMIDRFNRIVGEYFDLAIHGHAHEQSSEAVITEVPRYQIGSPGYGHYMLLSYENGVYGVERCVF